MSYTDFYLLKEGEYLSLEDEEYDRYLNLKIKQMLSTFTDEYSSEDINFIKTLQYPKEIEVETNDLKYKVFVDDLEELSSLIKSLPLEEECVVRIQSIGGRMSLASRTSED